MRILRIIVETSRLTPGISEIRRLSKLTYPACFYPCEQKEGGYTVEVPDLPGCVSEGDSLADALLMAADAASGWVLDELEDGKPAPAASPLSAVSPAPGGFVTMLALDMDALTALYWKKQQS